MLIKDWEYLEDKLSMGHMALFIITYLKKRNYRWQTSSINPADKVIPMPDYLDEVKKI